MLRRCRGQRRWPTQPLHRRCQQLLAQGGFDPLLRPLLRLLSCACLGVGAAAWAPRQQWAEDIPQQLVVPAVPLQRILNLQQTGCAYLCRRGLLTQLTMGWLAGNAVGAEKGCARHT